MVYQVACKSEKIGQCLVSNGLWACYASETARDMLLRKQPVALHILTGADLLQLVKLFPRLTFRTNCREHAYLEEEGRPVYFYTCDYPDPHFVFIPGGFEPEKIAVRKALNKEIFSINGFYYDIKKEIFYDPLDAYHDLKRAIIRTIETPQRTYQKVQTIALETAKVFSQTGFEIDEELNLFLREMNGGEIYRSIDEGIASDFINILVSRRAGKALTLLYEWGILQLLLPEVTGLLKVCQDKDHHPEGNAFWHTLYCLDCVKKPSKNLMMAILLHDTGKAMTMSSRGVISFPKHSAASKLIAEKVLRRFHFSEEDREEVFFLVQNHMMLTSVDSLPESRLKQIFRSPYFPNLLELFRADLASGYHSAGSYYHAARTYRVFKRIERLKKLGVLVRGSFFRG